MEHIQSLVDRINRYMISRQRLDLHAVYARLAPRYPDAFTIEQGDADRGEDFEILSGHSPAGRFEVYDNGLDIVFGVDRPDGSYTHWHPANFDEVIADLEAFMQGYSRD